MHVFNTIFFLLVQVSYIWGLRAILLFRKKNVPVKINFNVYAEEKKAHGNILTCIFNKTTSKNIS